MAMEYSRRSPRSERSGAHLREHIPQQQTLILLLPCGGGFPKERLGAALETRGLLVQRIYFGNSSERATLMQRTIDAIASHDGPVVLHGWSLGGGLALRIAREWSNELRNIRAIALYAAAGGGRDLRAIGVPVIKFYHNKYDSVISVANSITNCDSINEGKERAVASIEISEAYFGEAANHHQCDEFEARCVQWIVQQAGTLCR